jgi:S1-C subfamily serine protease
MGGGATQRMAEFVVNKIIETQADYYRYRGELGLIRTIPVTTGIAASFPNLVGTSYDLRGELIQEVVPGGPADLAGLQVDYIITSVNGVVCGNVIGQTSFTTPYWHLPVATEVVVRYIDPSISTTEQEVTISLGHVDPASDIPLSGRA